MYSIMIVDDEKAIRENLAGIIRFEEYGFKVCQTAKNGEDALSRLSACRPDVIFLDVCMPVMDGLDFLREIHKRPEEDIPYIVMLSGYSDFEYARSAMRYGVKAYLTKPVDEEEAGVVLGELREALRKRTQNKKQSDLRKRVSDLKNLYHSGVGDRASFAGYRMMYCVVLGESDAKEENWRIAREVIEERLCGGEAAFCKNQGSISSYLVEPGTWEEYQQSITLFARHLLHGLKQRGIECALLFDGTLFGKAKGSFRKDYDAHLYQMLTEVFWEKETILQSRMTEDAGFPESRLEKEEEYLEELKKAIRGRNREGLRKAYETIVFAVAEKRLHVIFLQEINYRIYYDMMDLLSGEQITDISISPLDMRDAACFMRYPEWKARLWEQVLTVYNGVENRNPAGRYGIGEQAIAYIRSHFREQISLQSVADRFFVSASYLGRCLQKSLGCNFRQYLNELRVEEAKRLLRDTDERIYEIAEKTGFSESKYFISRFTDQAGISPVEYRKQNRE